MKDVYLSLMPSGEHFFKGKVGIEIGTPCITQADLGLEWSYR